MSCYDPCNSNTAIEQAVDDALADRITDLDGYTQSSKNSAAQAAASAADSAQSAEESKGYRDQAQQVANTATGLVPDLLEASSNLKEATDTLEAIGEIASSYLVTNVFYTVVGGENTYTFAESQKVAAVQAVYIEGVRQDAGQGFVYDAPSRTITFAETFSADQAGSVITIQVGQSNADSPETVLSALAGNSGASLVGTTDSISVQEKLDQLSAHIEGVDSNEQSIARVFNVKSTEVGYLKTGLVLDDYIILYDEATQTSWSKGNATGTVSAWGINGNVLTLGTSAGTYTLTKAVAYTSLTSVPADQMIYKYPAPLAVSMSQADKNAERLSVKDFGAKGDGNTDDTAAIQAAINYASVEFQDSRTVFFPKGIYQLSSGLVLNPLCHSLTLEGEGEHSRIRNGTATSFTMLSWSSLPTDSVATSRQRITNLCFDGNAAVGNGSCIDTAHVSMLTVENITFLNISTTGIGLYLNGHSDGVTYSHEGDVRNIRVISKTGFAGIACSKTFSDSIVDGYWCEGQFGLGYCLYLADYSASNQFSRMHISNARYSVAYVGDLVLGSSFININFDNTSESADSSDVVRLVKTKNAKFTNCRFGPGVAGKASLSLEDGAKNNSFDACSFWGGTRTATPVNESGTGTDFNIFNNATIIDTYTSVPSLVGLNSRFRLNGAASTVFAASFAGITAGQTVCMGTGYGSTDGPSHAYVVVGNAGYLRKVALHLSSAASSGSITVRVYKNGSLLDSFVVSGGSTYIAAKVFNTPVAENDFINLEVVSASGTPTTDLRSVIIVD